MIEDCAFMSCPLSVYDASHDLGEDGYPSRYVRTLESNSRRRRKESMMEQTNYMALVQGLKLYTDAMRRFVRERLQARYGARWWEDVVLTHLYDPQRSNLERDVRSNANREKQDFIDPGHLVHIIAEESRGAFAGYFDDTRRSKPLLQLVLDARNTHAHPPSGDLSRDDVDYALATIEQLLTGARQPEAATVHQLRMGLHDASRPSNTTMPTTRLKASQELDGAIVNARDLRRVT